MNVKPILQGKKINIFLAVTFILLLAYLAIKFIFSGTDPLTLFLSYITSPYLLLVEKFANLLLQWAGEDLTIQNHIISLNGRPVDGFTTQIMYKKFTLFYILIVWLTQSSALKKIWFTGIYLVVSFLASSIYNVAGAYSVTGQTTNTVIISATHSVIFFCMNTILLLWYCINKRSLSGSSPTNAGITKWLENKMLAIIIIIYAYAIVLFSLVYFDFSLWIDFILKSSQRILGLFGYDSIVEDDLLIGNNGLLSMYRTCLGIMTMFLFASGIYLTGTRQKRGWGFIILGLLILNIANIVRVVLVFVHLQKHGGYLLATDVHDLYNYATYFIVFILWVIWIEKIKGIKTIFKHKGNP